LSGIYVYVANVDFVYGKALAGGSQTIEPSETIPYGDRRATVRDPPIAAPRGRDERWTMR